ncbi:MAG: hypothetical protein KC910_00645 [Candidatus Eremiobacteraeota bacterium]|nr:hypothetical protein [Candidatus Eremiobacteraeota bacterium]
MFNLSQPDGLQATLILLESLHPFVAAQVLEELGPAWTEAIFWQLSQPRREVLDRAAVQQAFALHCPLDDEPGLIAGGLLRLWLADTRFTHQDSLKALILMRPSLGSMSAEYKAWVLLSSLPPDLAEAALQAAPREVADSIRVQPRRLYTLTTSERVRADFFRCPEALLALSKPEQLMNLILTHWFLPVALSACLAV